jgi:hypothetical protein
MRSRAARAGASDLPLAMVPLRWSPCRSSSGTDAEARRFPGCHVARFSTRPFRPGLRSRAAFRLRPDGRDVHRTLQRQRRARVAERGKRGCRKRVLHLPRTGRAGRWSGQPAARRARPRLYPAAARCLCRRQAPASADELDRAATFPRGARGSRWILCRHAVRNPARAAFGGAGSVRAWRPESRASGLCELPRHRRPGHRSGQSAARGPARRLSGRTDRRVAPRPQAQRSWRRHASDQPASDSPGSRGSRGLC